MTALHINMPVAERLARMRDLVPDAEEQRVVLAEALRHATVEERPAIARAALTDAPSLGSVAWLAVRWPDRLPPDVITALETPASTPAGGVVASIITALVDPTGIDPITASAVAQGVPGPAGGLAGGGARRWFARHIRRGIRRDLTEASSSASDAEDSQSEGAQGATERAMHETPALEAGDGGLFALRLRLIGLAGVRRDPRHAPALARWLTAPNSSKRRTDPEAAAAHDRLVDAAAEALLEIATAWSQRARTTCRGPAELLALDEALARAFDEYPAHRRRSALLAVALVAQEYGPALGRLLQTPEHPAHFALRGVLRTLTPEQLAPHAISWLGHDCLTNQVVARLPELARRSDTLEAMLDDVHLTLLPAPSRRLQRLDPRRPACVGVQSALMLSPTAQRRLPRWMLSIPMLESDRIATLGELVTARSRATRLAAVCGLVDILDRLDREVDHAEREGRTKAVDPADQAAALRGLESFCFDDDARIAALATQARLRLEAGHRDRSGSMRDPEAMQAEARLLRNLRNSPHLRVRELADVHDHATAQRQPASNIAGATVSGSEAMIDAFDEAYQSWLAADGSAERGPEHHRIALRHLRRRDPATFDLLLASRIATAAVSDDCDDVLRLVDELRIVAVPGALGPVERTVFALAEHHDPRIVATALRVMARFPLEAVVDVLKAAIRRHPDRRVRANAIEALGTLGPAHVANLRSVVEPFAWHAHDGRTQANAIRVLARIDAAAALRCLRRMLREPSAEHEASGLWVLRRLRHERSAPRRHRTTARRQVPSAGPSGLARTTGTAAPPVDRPVPTGNAIDRQSNGELPFDPEHRVPTVRLTQRARALVLSISPHRADAASDASVRPIDAESVAAGGGSAPNDRARCVADHGVASGILPAILMASVTAGATAAVSAAPPAGSSNPFGGWTIIHLLSAWPFVQTGLGLVLVAGGCVGIRRWWSDCGAMRRGRLRHAAGAAVGVRTSDAADGGPRLIRLWAVGAAHRVQRCLRSVALPGVWRVLRPNLAGPGSAIRPLLVRRWEDATRRSARQAGPTAVTSRDIAEAFGGLQPGAVRRLRRQAKRAGLPGGIWPLLISDGAMAAFRSRTGTVDLGAERNA